MSKRGVFVAVSGLRKRLSALVDQVLSCAGAGDFEVFRAAFLRTLSYLDGARGGRPSFDLVMMFKVLIIQAAKTCPTSIQTP